MSNQSILVRAFAQHHQSPVSLTKTQFTFRGGEPPIEAVRGLYGSSFKWSAGVKALSVLLLKTVAGSLRRTTEAPAVETEEPAYVLRGHRRTPAASLNDALTKQHAWVFDMFGEAGNLPRLRDMIQRRNPDFNTDKDAPVDLWVDPDVLPAERIQITLNGKPVNDYETLERIAEELAREWIAKPGAGKKAEAAVDKSPLTMAGDMFRSIQGDRVLQFVADLSALMHDDVVWDFVGSPKCPLLGRHEGKARVQEVGMANFSQMAEHEPKVYSVLHRKDTIIILGDDTFLWKPTNERCRSQYQYVLTFRDEKIVHMHETCIGFEIGDDAK